MSTDADSTDADRAPPNIVWHPSELARGERWKALSVTGASVWFTGLSGSGKSTVAARVERLLLEAGRPTYRLDGDNLRHGLNGDLGFSPEDRAENVRRAAEVARLFADAGMVSLVPVISPYRAGRERARAAHEMADLVFVEVFVDTPLEVCEARDPKGLYQQVRAGKISGFTGIDAPYEAPSAPDLRLTPQMGDADALAKLVMGQLSGLINL